MQEKISLTVDPSQSLEALLKPFTCSIDCFFKAMLLPKADHDWESLEVVLLTPDGIVDSSEVRRELFRRRLRSLDLFELMACSWVISRNKLARKVVSLQTQIEICNGLKEVPFADTILGRPVLEFRWVSAGSFDRVWERGWSFGGVSEMGRGDKP